MNWILFIVILVACFGLSAYMQTKIQRLNINRLVKELSSTIVGLVFFITAIFSFALIFIDKPDPNKIVIHGVADIDTASEEIDNHESETCYDKQGPHSC